MFQFNRFLVAATFVGVFSIQAQAQSYSLDTLSQMDKQDLDATYARAQSGEIPSGESNGRAIFFAGTQFSETMGDLASLFWQGKIFDTEDGILYNKVMGFHAIKAEVYPGKSLFDGKKSIIVDYSRTSLLAHQVRDEIRQVGPGLYLGRAYIRTWLGSFYALSFALDFNQE